MQQPPKKRRLTFRAGWDDRIRGTGRPLRLACRSGSLEKAPLSSTGPPGRPLRWVPPERPSDHFQCQGTLRAGTTRPVLAPVAGAGPWLGRLALEKETWNSGLCFSPTPSGMALGGCPGLVEGRESTLPLRTAALLRKKARRTSRFRMPFGRCDEWGLRG
jgi:hypothetical protein